MKLMTRRELMATTSLWAMNEKYADVIRSLRSQSEAGWQAAEPSA
jgi:hypothetical protein